MIDIIIVPQGAEYQSVKKGLQTLKTQQPLIISIPIGTKQIEKTLSDREFWQTKPKRVLMMGLCGSLSSQYSVGDTVLYHNCYSQKTSENLVADSQLNRIINQKINKIANDSVSGITSYRIITSVKEKQQLAEKFTAKVVDMESFAYLKLLQEKAIAVSILRVISDDLQSNLPNLEQTIDKEGNIRPIMMTQKMLKEPIKSLKFIKNSLKGLKQMQQITNKLFS